MPASPPGGCLARPGLLHPPADLARPGLAGVALGLRAAHVGKVGQGAEALVGRGGRAQAVVPLALGDADGRDLSRGRGGGGGGGRGVGRCGGPCGHVDGGGGGGRGGRCRRSEWEWEWKVVICFDVEVEGGTNQYAVVEINASSNAVFKKY